jgi:hypothetical protein
METELMADLRANESIGIGLAAALAEITANESANRRKITLGCIAVFSLNLRQKIKRPF